MNDPAGGVPQQLVGLYGSDESQDIVELCQINPLIAVAAHAPCVELPISPDELAYH